MLRVDRLFWPQISKHCAELARLKRLRDAINPETVTECCQHLMYADAIEYYYRAELPHVRKL